MATILRHPVPTDSYNPNRPLNDLVGEQFKHFVEVATRLPPELRVEMPVPAVDDVAGVNQFMAAVTERLMSVKRTPLKLVVKRTRKPKVPVLAIAAEAEEPAPDAASKKAKTGRKSKARRKGK